MQPTNINSDSDSAMTDSIPQSPREEIGDSPGMADTSSDMAPDESAPGTPALSSISFSSSPHDLLRRLREAAFILYLLDPVRIYNPLPPPIPPNVEVFSGSTYVIVASNSLSQSRDRGEDTNSSEKLKKRLIDALAFICATEREGGDLGAGAAVCIDRPASATAGGGSGEGADIRYTIRIAQNGEVGSEVLDGVRDIVKHLEKFADGLSRNPPAANLYPITDTQVYVTIIRMHLAKVRYHLSEIRDPLAHVQSSLDQHLDTTDSAKKMKTLAQLPLPELKKLQSWLRTFSTQLNSALDSSDVPIAAVSAAFQIKRTPLFGHLEILCRSLGCQVIGVHLGKLGRYKFACKALLHTCQKWPEVFLGMTVEAVPVGDSEESNIGRLERPTREEEIRRVVSKILPPPSEDGEAETQAETPVAVPTVDEAVQALLPTISQEQFTSAWSNLTCSVHAETRIVDFYSSHPDCVPISGTADECADNTRYVGLSRKPCYLCSLYVDRKGENYILGGAEAEKASPGSPGGVANGGGVKRVLDPSWSVSTNVVAPEDSEYRILDDLAGVIEGELKLEDAEVGEREERESGTGNFGIGIDVDGVGGGRSVLGYT
ncbi:hypothetical protein BDZ91DRAFT_227833 [Kalaharituber pfeilii]|nr:hypothetical protein BDZ91DRAFT_227833 [Kalaharituber pfeilii]